MRIQGIVLRSIAVVGLAATMALPAVGVARADQAAYYQHTRECVKLFFTDREAHAASCLPSNIPPEFKSMSGNVGGGGFVGHICYRGDKEDSE